jgi:hypothetical protein
MTKHFIGLDLGQAQEFTGLAVFEREAEHRYAVRHLERWPLGTAYPAIVANVARRVEALQPSPVLAIDITAVGQSVLGLFVQAELCCPIYPITITQGVAVTAGPHGPLLPKKELVSVLQVLLQTGALKVASTLPEARTLVAELSAFKANVSTPANGGRRT